MIKIFTTNKNGKIELTAKELKELLDESYWDGYRAHGGSWTYTTPNWSPYVYCSNGDSSTSIKLNPNTITTSVTASSEDHLTVKNADLTTSTIAIDPNVKVNAYA